MSVNELLKKLVLTLENRTGLQISGRLGFGQIPYRPAESMVVVEDLLPLRGLGWAPEHDLDAGLREIVDDALLRWRR